MPVPVLFTRLSKFLHDACRTAAEDCAAILPQDGSTNAPAGFPWQERLPLFMAQVAAQLEASAAGEGWIEGGILPEGDEYAADIQRSILEAFAARTFFLNALNRFQSSQAGFDGVKPSEMTELRQDALEIFDRLSSAELAEWMGGEGLESIEEASGEEAPEAVPPSGRMPAADTLPPPPPAAELTSRVLQELREGLTTVGSQVGKMRVALPAGSAEPAVLALRQLQRLSSLVSSIIGPKTPAEELGPQEPIRVAPLAVRAFLESLADAFRPLAEHKGLRFVVTCDPALATVETDAPKLHRAASLLLANAIQYTAAGAAGIAARTSGADWVLTVEDTGPGMEPDKLRSVLMGDGIGGDRVPHGLAVTRELVHLLGGHLDADSVLRRGSRLSICLPRTGRRPNSR